MSRIAETFARLKSEGRKGLIPFITAGDPDLATTSRLLQELSSAGSSIIELGVPFSDPMADGPVIQRASERALKHSCGLAEILETAAEARKISDTAIVLFSYLNPLLQYGLEKLSRDAKEAGVDGVLITDLVPEESEEFTSALQRNGLDLIFLAAPTSTDERLQMIAAKASGFIYAVSRLGVTGTREELSSTAEQLVDRIRKFSSLPIAVGFGISNGAQVRDTCRYADAAVVGSAIVAEIESAAHEPDLVQRVGAFTRSLISGM